MIARLWRGWTTLENAEAYERLLLGHILPGIHRVEGYLGAYVVRRDVDAEVEFATITLWESWDAVRLFAGDDPEVAVVSPEARAVLERFDERSLHYEVVATPD